MDVQVAGASGVLVSLTLSSAHVSTVGGIRHTDDFRLWPQNKTESSNVAEIWRKKLYRALGELEGECQTHID